MTVRFEDPFVENGDVHFAARHDSGRCSFRVTREVLGDLEQVDAPLADDDLIGAYRRHLMAIQTVALSCLGRGEPASGEGPLEIGADHFGPPARRPGRAMRR